MGQLLLELLDDDELLELLDELLELLDELLLLLDELLELLDEGLQSSPVHIITYGPPITPGSGKLNKIVVSAAVFTPSPLKSTWTNAGLPLVG